jgi:hypothetical protein
MSRLLRLVFGAVLILALLESSPACAAFTPSEAASVSGVVALVETLDRALNELSFAIRSGQDTKPLIRETTLHVKEAVREASLTLALLVDVVPDAAFTAPDPATRAVRVKEAWFHLERVGMFSNMALSASAKAVGENTRRARMTWLPQALTRIGQINRTLSYSNPRPASYPTLIGPHGSYDEVQFFQWRGSWYALDMLEEGLANFGVDDEGVDVYTFVNRAAILYDAFANGLALMAGIGDPTLSQFWRVNIWIIQFTSYLKTGLPLRYMELQTAVASGSAKWAGVRIRITDSWRQMDESIAQAQRFPKCSMVKDPEGCARGQDTR